mgnify:CR=1 FL=1
MLKEQSYTDKAKSVYICDMCKKEINLNEKNKLSVQKQGKSKKIKDLCDRCYGIVIKSIENYAKKKEELCQKKKKEQ